MNTTFALEARRKTKLFEAWIDYLHEVHSDVKDQDYEEIYEGKACVSDLSKNRIGFYLFDERKLRHIPITPQISEHTRRLDHMYVVLGKQKGKWRTLEVISIASIIDWECWHVNIMYNPLYVNSPPTDEPT